MLTQEEVHSAITEIYKNPDFSGHDIQLALCRLAKKIHVDMGSTIAAHVAEIGRLKVDVDCAEQANDNLREMVALRDAEIAELRNRIIDLTPYPTTEEADEILRAAGFDPAAVGEHGRQLAERALKAIRPQAPTDPR